MAQPSISEQSMADLLQSVEADLQRVDQWILEQLSAGPTVLKPLLDYIGRFRGKRLRAAQVLLVGKACGSLTEEHIKVAGIIEMIHSATLVHDDLLDEAKERRKLDCLHVEWGAHTAVLLGDWIYSQAFMASTRMKDQTCSQVLSEATGRVCAGEMHQNLTRGLFALSEQDYFAQIDGKTAALFEAGGRLAAHYSGADASMCDAAARYGLLAGRAFQVVDDMLDLAGSEKEVGKSLGTDWQRGKMTLPLIRLRESLSSANRDALEDLFQQGTDREVLQQEPFANALVQAMTQVRSEVEALLAESTSQLEQLPEQAIAAELAQLTHFLGARKL
ncbi:MAG: polyprenyl synthetase family protein [Planctomycetota bacterium]|nr:polyprenyl synthetase family protein [Planctomycetota bacterium]